MSYNIKLEIFEGPFDLLFHLIDKNEVDIYDIPIAKITAQYLQYIEAMQSMDLEIASEFLIMAASLLAIKAKMLLPKPPKELLGEGDEDGMDPRNELVERLLEYKRFKEVAEYLKDREEDRGKVYTRPNDEEMFIHLFNEENPLEGISVNSLLDALKEVLDRIDEVEVTGEIHREEVTIRDKMKEIRKRIMFQPNGMVFKELFTLKSSKVEIIITFLALLELIKLKKIQIHQSKVFGEIMIYSRVEEIA
jgi:segregation and condensation protein A